MKIAARPASLHAVIPAQAGIHFDFALNAQSLSKSKMDPGVRRDDGRQAFLKEGRT